MNADLEQPEAPKRKNGRRPGSAPPGRAYQGAPWIPGASPRLFTLEELRHTFDLVGGIKDRTLRAVAAVLCQGLSYKAAAAKLGETPTYVRNVVINSAERVGGNLWMYDVASRRSLVIPDVPPELHEQARALVAQLVLEHKRKTL